AASHAVPGSFCSETRGNRIFTVRCWVVGIAGYTGVLARARTGTARDRRIRERIRHGCPNTSGMRGGSGGHSAAVAGLRPPENSSTIFEQNAGRSLGRMRRVYSPGVVGTPAAIPQIVTRKAERPMVDITTLIMDDHEKFRR